MVLKVIKMPVTQTLLQENTSIVVNFSIPDMRRSFERSVESKDFGFGVFNDNLNVWRAFTDKCLQLILNELKNVEITVMVEEGLLDPSLPLTGKSQDMYIMKSIVDRTGHISAAHRLMTRIANASGLLYFNQDIIEHRLMFDYLEYLNEGGVNEFGTDPVHPFIESTLMDSNQVITRIVESNIGLLDKLFISND